MVVGCCSQQNHVISNVLMKLLNNNGPKLDLSGSGFIYSQVSNAEIRNLTKSMDNKFIDE